MEEFQEADILWPESMQNPESFFDWPIYHHFTPSELSESRLSSASSSNSTCTQDELQESELSWTGTGDDSFFLSIGNLSKEICCEEEWQEADVLWPEQESLNLKHRGFEFEWENCSDGDEDQLIIMKGEATIISSPIDIPKRKINHFAHLL